MTTDQTTLTTRIGAYTAFAGSACALLGAALLGASGADIDVALASGDMRGFLQAAGEHRLMLASNLTLWIFMVFLLGIAATVMAGLSKRRLMLAQIAMYCFWTGVPLVLAAYIAWLAIILQTGSDSSAAAITVAEVLGWFASRADWVATILIIGIGPTLLSIAGKEDWVPEWLARWSWLTAFAGLLTAIAMLTGGSGLSTYGFVIVPVGVGWMIAAGIVLLKRSSNRQ